MGGKSHSNTTKDVKSQIGTYSQQMGQRPLRVDLAMGVKVGKCGVEAGELGPQMEQHRTLRSEAGEEPGME